MSDTDNYSQSWRMHLNYKFDSIQWLHSLPSRQKTRTVGWVPSSHWTAGGDCISFSVLQCTQCKQHYYGCPLWL